MTRSLSSLLVAALCTSLSASAQKDIPAYGKIDKTDLDLKECTFDQAAEAEVLFDVGEVYCNLNLNSITDNVLNTEFKRHIRLKILSDKGLDRANIKIRYRSERGIEDIKNISAQTINTDASGNAVYTKVDKAQIFRKKINKRYSEVIFAFPEAKKGSILEYEYTDQGEGFAAMSNWYFQKSIPVKLSRFSLNFPNELEVNATMKGILHVDEKEDQKGYRNVKVYTMQDVPALRDEAYITCEDDYLQQVIPLLQAVEIPGRPRKSLLRTWPGIIKELMDDEDFGIQLRRNIPRTADLDVMLKKLTDPYQKMVTIHDYVRKNMQWNEYDGIWALDGVRSAWKDKKGTTGEINLILVNLLKDAGLTVHPVLVSTRENGRVNTGVAGYEQFDKVMAYVEIGDHVYVLDATDKFTPANLIPYGVLYSEGLVIEKIETDQWGWKTLWNENQIFKNSTIIMADIDEKGIIKGEASVGSFEYSRMERAPILKKGKQKFIENFYSSRNASVTVDSLSFENEDVDSLPLNQHIKFTAKTSASGDYQYFNANLFSGLEKNPFISDSRFSDVFFGTNQKYMLIGHYTIPEGFKFDELPKNTRMIMPDTSITFSRIMEADGRDISVRIQLDIKKPFYTVDDYPYFQEFYKKLYELINEQIVFKKK